MRDFWSVFKAMSAADRRAVLKFTTGVPFHAQFCSMVHDTARLHFGLTLRTFQCIHCGICLSSVRCKLSATRSVITSGE